MVNKEQIKMQIIAAGKELAMAEAQLNLMKTQEDVQDYKITLMRNQIVSLKKQLTEEEKKEEK